MSPTIPGKPIKIAVIGAGSPYTPELIEGLAAVKARIPVSEVALMDIDRDRLATMAAFCRRYAARLGFDACFTISETTDVSKAVIGADFVNTQIRVGGNRARATDERICLKHSVLGQETTGAAGLMKALRTIPAMLEIARIVEVVSPDAWIVNYANPTGMVAEALTKYAKARIVGLCSGGFFQQQYVASALSVPKSAVKYSYIGANHMNFAYDVTISGKPLTPEEFDHVADKCWGVAPEVIRLLKLLPSPYLQYYYHTQKHLSRMKESDKTRGEEVLEVEAEVFRDYADIDRDTKPEALAKRGGGGYSEVAIGIVEAMSLDEDRWTIANVPNKMTVPWLPPDCCIETACLVNKHGVTPLALPYTPAAIRGIVSAVKNYEELAVEAAVECDKDKALLALMAHPLVRDYDVAIPLFDELLNASLEWLPTAWREILR